MEICVRLDEIPVGEKRNPFTLVREVLNVEILEHESMPMGSVIFMKLDKTVDNLPSYIEVTENRF